jgi:hypothetical protein
MILTSKTLKDRAMLAVDRKKLDAIFPDERHHDVAGDDKGFFVCKSNALSMAYRGNCWFQASETDKGADDDINIIALHNFFEPTLTRENLCCCVQGFPCLVGKPLIENYNTLWLESVRLSKQEFKVRMGGKIGDAKSIRKVANHLKAVLSDRTRRSKDRNMFLR